MYQLLQNHRRGKFLLITGLIVLLGLGSFIVFRMMRNSSAQNKNAGNNAPQVQVDVLRVPRTDLIKRISLTGQTVPRAQVDIAAKYQGRLVAVNAELGQQVGAGQALIIQDTGDAELAVAQNRAAYQQAAADAVNSNVAFNANYNKAKADYDRALGSYQRYKTLYEAGAISKDALDTSEQQMIDARSTFDSYVNQMNSSSVPATVESARAAAQKAQHGIDAADKQREDLILRAPFSGTIGYRQAETGAIVSAGQKLLTVVDNSKIYVDCQVSEPDLPALFTGMEVNVQIEALSKVFPGKVIYISPASDSSNMVFSLRIDLTDLDPAIRGGMFARTAIQTVLRPQALVIPKTAVLEKNGKTYVYVVNDQNITEERAIQLGARGDQNIEVLSGLNEGEQVAVSNLSRLRSGLKISSNPVTLENGSDKQ